MLRPSSAPAFRPARRNERMIRKLSFLFIVSACGGGGAGGSGAAQPTNPGQGPSVAFKGEECHAVWQRPTDASGADLPWDSAQGVAGPAWAKGSGVREGAKEKQGIDLIWFDAIAKDDSQSRYVRFEDRRMDPVLGAILVDECVESGKCTSDGAFAGLLSFYAHQLDQTRLSAATKKLEISSDARDAFVDRTLANVKKLDAFTQTLAPQERAYLVDLPNSVHQAR